MYSTVGSLSRGRWDGPPPITPLRHRFQTTDMKPEDDFSKASDGGPFLTTTQPGEITRAIEGAYNGARKRRRTTWLSSQ